MIVIRSERSVDHEAVRRVVVDAFTHSKFGHNGEAELVEQLRRDCNDALSLVARQDDQIVGHILFTPVTIQSDRGPVSGSGLAPLAVARDRQNTGIGTALVKQALATLAAEQCPFVVVLGQAAYYHRFGFVPAADYGVAHGFASVPQELFFMNCLEDQRPGSTFAGPCFYHPGFGPQHMTAKGSGLG